MNSNESLWVFGAGRRLADGKINDPENICLSGPRSPLAKINLPVEYLLIIFLYRVKIDRDASVFKQIRFCEATDIAFININGELTSDFYTLQTFTQLNIPENADSVEIANAGGAINVTINLSY